MILDLARFDDPSFGKRLAWSGLYTTEALLPGMAYRLRRGPTGNGSSGSGAHRGGSGDGDSRAGLVRRRKPLSGD